MTYFLPHDHWIYRTATQWSPLRRWAATAFLVIIIAAPWWALSFRHLLKNVRTYKLELNNPIGAQEIQQLQQQRDTLQTQLNTSGRLQADYVSAIIDVATHAKLTLDECSTQKTDNPAATHLAFKARGSFDRLHQFFESAHSPHLTLQKCTLKRITDEILECIIQYGVIDTAQPANQLPIH